MSNINGVVHDSLYDPTTQRSLLGAVLTKYAGGIAVFTEEELKRLTADHTLTVALVPTDDGGERLELSVAPDGEAAR